MLRRPIHCLLMAALLTCVASSIVKAQPPVAQPPTAQPVSEPMATAELASPDGELLIRVYVAQGKLYFEVDSWGEPLLKRSRLGLAFAEKVQPVKMIGGTTAARDETYQPVWGKRKKVRNAYHELQVKLQIDEPKSNVAGYRVVLRASDDGLAIRYVLTQVIASIDGQEAKPLVLRRDLTEFHFANDPTCWSYNGENPNIGPERLSKIDGPRQVPLMAHCGEQSVVALYEAALEHAPWMSLTGKAGTLILRTKVGKYQAAAGHQTPWRVVMAGDTAGDILDSDLLMNLNPHNQVADAAEWVKPGVCFWDWRAWGHRTEDGFTYELNLESWKRFIDFAEETGVPYLLLDANWYGPEFEKDSNPTETGKVSAVREMLAYAKEHNVGALLYLNDVAGRKYDLDAVLANYHDWGAVGIKYGFMKGGGKEKVERTRKIIAMCAEHHLMVDFHDGPIPPSGDMRTYPNCITREYCHAQSDSKKAFTPGTFVTHCYVNGLTGPLDMSNGLFDLENSMKERPRIFEEVRSTIVAEAARSLIVFTGLNVLPDSADSYREHKELFEYIAAQKMPWDESRTLSGEIGKSITTMRRTGDVWLVGSATNEEARTIEIPLSFLPPGTYEATIYADAADAHFQTNREAYEIIKQQVTPETIITAKLAPGGGHGIRILPVN